MCIVYGNLSISIIDDRLTKVKRKYIFKHTLLYRSLYQTKVKKQFQGVKIVLFFLLHLLLSFSKPIVSMDFFFAISVLSSPSPTLSFRPLALAACRMPLRFCHLAVVQYSIFILLLRQREKCTYWTRSSTCTVQIIEKVERSGAVAVHTTARHAPLRLSVRDSYVKYLNRSFVQSTALLYPPF